MPVDDDGFLVDFQCPRPEFRVGSFGHRLGRGRNDEGQERDKGSDFDFHDFVAFLIARHRSLPAPPRRVFPRLGDSGNYRRPVCAKDRAIRAENRRGACGTDLVYCIVLNEP